METTDAGKSSHQYFWRRGDDPKLARDVAPRNSNHHEDGRWNIVLERCPKFWDERRGPL